MVSTKVVRRGFGWGSADSWEAGKVWTISWKKTRLFSLMANLVSASNEWCISTKPPLRLTNEKILRRLLKTIILAVLFWELKVKSIKLCVKCSTESRCRCAISPQCLLLFVATNFYFNLLSLVYILRSDVQYRPKIHVMHEQGLLFVFTSRISLKATCRDLACRPVASRGKLFVNWSDLSFPFPSFALTNSWQKENVLFSLKENNISSS